MFRQLISIIFILALLTQPAISKDVTSNVNLYGTTFTYGVPPWIDVNAEGFDPKDLINKSKPFRDQTGPSFILEQIQADEEFDNWTIMFAVKALAVNQDVPLNAWVGNNLQPFQQACEGFSVREIMQNGDALMLLVICPKVQGLNRDGYSQGTGEIALMAFFKTDKVLISHYVEWRGTSFDGSDNATWPVELETLRSYMPGFSKAKANSPTGVIQFAYQQPEQEYLPIVRVPPQYPARAMENKVEGYVLVSFTVSAEGTTEDLKVIESSHKMFERNAVKAAEKYKYRPRIIDGEAVDVEDVQVRITFNLAN